MFKKYSPFLWSSLWMTTMALAPRLAVASPAQEDSTCSVHVVVDAHRLHEHEEASHVADADDSLSEALRTLLANDCDVHEHASAQATVLEVEVSWKDYTNFEYLVSVRAPSVVPPIEPDQFTVVGDPSEIIRALEGRLPTYVQWLRIPIVEEPPVLNPAPPAEDEPPMTPTENASGRGWSAVGKAGVAVAAAGVATATAGAVLFAKQSDEFRHRDGAQQIVAVRRFEVAGPVVLGLGAALTIGGVAMIVADVHGKRRKGARELSISPTFGPRGSHVVLSGRWGR